MGVTISVYAEVKDAEGRWRTLYDQVDNWKDRELEYILTGYYHRYTRPGMENLPTLEDARTPIPDVGESSWADIDVAREAKNTPVLVGAGQIPAQALLEYPWDRLKEVPYFHHGSVYECTPEEWWELLRLVRRAVEAGQEVRVFYAMS